jgi:uncharacterized protein (DUF362 family)/NAD-dependent dihydropyrimidine dehydrogenase PreA subunit
MDHTFEQPAPARVSIARCPDYQHEHVCSSIRASLDHLGGIGAFVARNDRVLLKPNFLIGRSPERCVNTHPAVVKAVAELVLEAGGKPFIGDSPQLGSARNVAEKCGVGAVARELGLEIAEFDPVEVKNERGNHYRHFVIGKAVLEADVIINLPKLKTHSLTLLTLAVKNLFGCIPGPRKAQWHFRISRHGADFFARMLLDLYRLIQPPLTIVDGIVGMEGNGPGSGSPRQLGLIVSGTDAVAVDAVITEVLGINPQDYPTLRLAMSEGYGTPHLHDIDVLGEDLAQVRVPDFILPRMVTIPGAARALLMKVMKGPLTTRPVIDVIRCRGCSGCMKACPAGCITEEAGSFTIRPGQCIQCLCCMEVCPEGAIDLRDGFLLAAFKQLTSKR